MRKNLNKKNLEANSKNQTTQEATRLNYTLDGSKYIDETNNINFVSDEFSSDFDTYSKKEFISWECLPFSSKRNKNNKIFQKLKKKKNAKTKENKQQTLDKDKNIDNKIAKNEIFRSPKILDSITNIDNNESQKHHQPYMTSLTNSAFGFGFDLQGGNAENQLTYIVNVQPNGDAASKGLQNGDIIVSVQDKNVIGAKRIEIERLLEQYRVEQEIEIVVCRLKDPSYILNLSKKLSHHSDLKKSDNQIFDHDLNVNSTKQLRSLNDQIFSELISLQGSFLNDWMKPKHPPFSNSCFTASNSNKNELNKTYQINKRVKNKNMNELDQHFDRTNSKTCDKSSRCLNDVETNNRPFLTNIDFAQSNQKSQNSNDVSFVLYDNISGKSNIGSAGNRLSTTMNCSEKNDFIVISLSQQNTQFYHPQFKRIFSNCSHRNMKPLNFNSVKSMSLSINDFTGSILAAERDGCLNRKQTNEHVALKQLNSNKLKPENNKSQWLKQNKNPYLKHPRKNVSFMQTEVKSDHQETEFWKSQQKIKSNHLNASNLMPENDKTSMIESNKKQQVSLSASSKLSLSELAQKQKKLNFLKNDEQKLNEEFEANFIEIPINIPFLNSNLALESNVENAKLLQNRHFVANLESAVGLNKKNEEQFISADFLQIVPPIKQSYCGFIHTINGSDSELNESNKPKQERHVMIPKPSRRSIIPYELSCNDPYISIKQITVQNAESSNSNFVYNLNSLAFCADSSGLIEQNSQSLETISDQRVEKNYKDLDETFSSITQDSFENSFVASFSAYASPKTNTNENFFLDEQSATDLSPENQLKNINGLNYSNENETLTEKQIDTYKRYDHSISVLNSKIIQNNSSKIRDCGESLNSLEYITFKDQNSPERLENNENSIEIQIQNKEKECKENRDCVKESDDQKIYLNLRQNNKSNDKQLTEENVENIFNQTADELKSKDHFFTRSSQDVKQLTYTHNSFNISTDIEVSLNKKLKKMLNDSSSKLIENQIEFNVADDLENVLTSSSILASSINDDNEFKSGLNEAIEISSIDSKSETNKTSTNLPIRITSSLTPSVVFDDGYDSTISFKHTTNESYSSIDDLEVFQSNNTTADKKNKKSQISKGNDATRDVKDLEKIKLIDEVLTDINSSKELSKEIKAVTLDHCFLKNDCKEDQKNCILGNGHDSLIIDSNLNHCIKTQDEMGHFRFDELDENNLTKNCLIVIEELIKKIESYEKQKSQSFECISEICNQAADGILENNSRMDEMNDAKVNDGLLSCYEQMKIGEVTGDHDFEDHSSKSTKQIFFDLNSIELFKPNSAGGNFKEQNLHFFIFNAFISNCAKEIVKYFESNNKMLRSITNSKEIFNSSKLQTNKLNNDLNLAEILNATEKIDLFEIQDYFKPWNKDFEQHAYKMIERNFYPKIIKNKLSNTSIETQPQKKDLKNNLKRKRKNANSNNKVELAKFSRAIEKDDLDIFSIPPIYCVKKLQNIKSNEGNSTLSVDLYRTSQLSKESENSHSCQTKSITKNYPWINKKPIKTTRTNFGFLNRFKPAIAVINSQKKFDDSLHFNREKKELQKLNEVFAFCVEKVKILEAQNRKIEIKLEILRKSKQANPFQIEQMFMIELDEAKKVLEDIQIKKMKTESWLQKSTDELRLIKLKHQEFENILNNDRQKIIFLQEQLLSYESEIFSLKRLINNLKDEENLLKQNTKLLINEINIISYNLELEIHKSLDLEAKKHKLQEEIVVLKKKHCEELEDLKDKLITQNCFNPYQLIKDDLAGALQEIRNEFYTINSEQRNELEKCFYSKRTQLNKNLENDLSRNEIANQQNLKNDISRSKQSIIKLKAENILIECKIKGLEVELNNEQCQNLILTNKKEEEITYLKKILDKVKSDYENELCCKNELEKEIDLFRRLLEDEQKVLSTWVPFDDGSQTRLAEFKSLVSLLESKLEYISNESVLIFGDWNCDIKRGRRFDNLFKDFLSNNQLISVSPGTREDKIFTYKKGEYTSIIDHFIIKESFYQNVKKFEHLNYLENFSDHKPIMCEIHDLGYISMINNYNRKKKFHFFHWNKPEFVLHYKNLLSNNVKDLLNEISFINTSNINSVIKMLDKIHDEIPKILLKTARTVESSELKILMKPKLSIEKFNYSNEIVDINNKNKLLYKSLVVKGPFN
ncbi:Intermediate filament ifa-1, partial [Brachionus plicatilis]